MLETMNDVFSLIMMVAMTIFALITMFLVMNDHRHHQMVEKESKLYELYDELTDEEESDDLY